MGRKKMTEATPAAETTSATPTKPMSKAGAVKVALNALGMDAPYAALIAYVKKEMGMDVSNSDIGNAKSSLKPKPSKKPGKKASPEPTSETETRGGKSGADIFGVMEAAYLLVESLGKDQAKKLIDLVR